MPCPMQARGPIGCPATGRADCILGQGITWLEAGGAGIVCAAAAAISTSTAGLINVGISIRFGIVNFMIWLLFAFDQAKVDLLARATQ